MPEGLDDKLIVVETQVTLPVELAVDIGRVVLFETIVVAMLVQPLVVFVTKSVYVPADVAVAFCDVVAPLKLEPLQL